MSPAFRKRRGVGIELFHWDILNASFVISQTTPPVFVLERQSHLVPHKFFRRAVGPLQIQLWAEVLVKELYRKEIWLKFNSALGFQ